METAATTLSAALARLARGRSGRLRVARKRCRQGASWERRLVPVPGLAWADLVPGGDRVLRGLFRLLDAGLIELWLGDDGEFVTSNSQGESGMTAWFPIKLIYAIHSGDRGSPMRERPSPDLQSSREPSALPKMNQRRVNMDPMQDKEHKTRLPALSAALLLAAAMISVLPPAHADNCWDYANYDGYCTLNCDEGAGLSLSVGSQNEGNVEGEGSCPGAYTTCNGYAQCHGQSATLSTGGFGSCSGHADNGDVTVGCAGEKGTVPGSDAAMRAIRQLVATGAKCADVLSIALAYEFTWMAFASSAYEGNSFVWTQGGHCPFTFDVPGTGDGKRLGPWTCGSIGKANFCNLNVGANMKDKWMNPE